jgi:ppGpp synthetase/RelA/SpoT-type nucleotidyltranferase
MGAVPPSPPENGGLGESEKVPVEFKNYEQWLARFYSYDRGTSEAEYNATAALLQQTFSESPLWARLWQGIRTAGDTYRIRTGLDLLSSTDQPKLVRKSFTSFLEKTFRRNIRREVGDALLIPSNWLEQINDIVRTFLVVKYLDGVDTAVNALKAVCAQMHVPCVPEYKCNTDGYYAAHTYIKVPIDVPLTAGVRTLHLDVELQITTQLQEVLRKLSHPDYEKRRLAFATPDVPWQWRYRDTEFFLNYLGHTLHNIEGIIMDVRRRQEMENAKV